MSQRSHLRRGGAAAFAHKKRANPGCNTGGFYLSPTASQDIPYTSPVNITWDTTCLNTQNVDIYLFAPGTGASFIHGWRSVYYPSGSYVTNFEPKWWNSTASVNLQLAIVDSGTQPFQSPFPAGPVFSVTYQAPSSGSTPAAADNSKPDGAVTVVNNNPANHKRLSGGKVAAAVIMPLLFIAFLIGAAYIKIKRGKEKEKRKQWTENVDKRMSTISTDWKSISGAGANAAIRSSMAVGNRNSSFSFGGVRPESTFATEGGQAGIGARTVFPTNKDGSAPPMSQLRPGVSAALMADRVSRVSRVSFAPDTRLDSRRTVTSRAFSSHVIPPVPERNWEVSAPSSDGTLSPTQTDGPLTLTAEDIQARLSGRDAAPRPSVDEVMPALRMMRTGDPAVADGEGEEEPELLFSAQSPSFPALPSPAHSPTADDPVASAMSSFMPALPANVMSPDDMLRAYAERRMQANGASAAPTLPPASYAPSNMRTLYNPTTPVGPNSSFAAQQDVHLHNHYTGYSEEDPYGGTA